MFLPCDVMIKCHPQKGRDSTIFKFPAVKDDIVLVLWGQSSTSCIFPGEIRKHRSLAHSSIASSIIYRISIILFVFVTDFQTALSDSIHVTKANMEQK